MMLAGPRVGERARRDRVVAVERQLELDAVAGEHAGLVEVIALEVRAARCRSGRRRGRSREIRFWPTSGDGHVERGRAPAGRSAGRARASGTRREVRSGRREDVAAVEGPRDRCRRVARGWRARAPPRRRRARRPPAAAGRCRVRQAGDRRQSAARAPAMAADAGVDDREMHAGRHVRQRVAEHKRALQHLLRAGSRA